MCAVLSSVFATTVDNSGVYLYYLKGIVSVCFRCSARTVGFSGTRLYLCIYGRLKVSEASGGAMDRNVISVTISLVSD